MNVVFKNSPHMPPSLTSFSEKLFSGPIQKAIALLAVAIFGCLALYSFFSFRNYKGKTLKQNPQTLSTLKQTNKVNKLTHSKIVPSGKLPLPKNPPNTSQKPKLNSNSVNLSQPSKGLNKAFDTYRNAPKSCSEMHKNMIFQDIKSIEPVESTDKKDLSVVELMLQVSGLKVVDLNHPECARVVEDTFKYCNKEASEQLSIWLKKQNDFSLSLLRNCLKVLGDKYENQLPVSLAALLQLMKIYKDHEWNKKSKIFDPEICSAMKILIQDSPNDNHVVALGEWMMKQPQFNASIFNDWRKIFLKKQQDNKAAINLYYPLFQTMKAMKNF